MDEIILPKKEDSRWRSLLEGNIAHNFTFVAAGLCIARNIRELRKNNTDETYENALNEVYPLFQKYERFLKKDIAEIFK